MRPGLSLPCVAAAVTALSGCVAGDATLAERQELANVPAALTVPATAPAALVAAFDRHCVATPSDAAARTAQLRAAGYVPQGGWSGGTRRFVSGTRQPMVVLSQSGRSCAVRARARPGQDSAIAAWVGRRWPGARQTVRDGGLTTLWRTTAPEAPVIAVLRNAAGPLQNEITLALVRP